MNWEIFYTIGYPGLFVTSFLAATVIPFSSEALFTTMLLLDFKPVYCIIFATAGNWSGGMFTYAVGRSANWKWIEKWLKIKKEKVLKMKLRIEKYGSLIAFFSWLPLVGDVMVVALGFFRINVVTVAFFMLIGKLTRFIFAALIVFFIYNKLS